MKRKYFIVMVMTALICCLLSSCSGGTGGIAPDDGTDPVGSLTSQMEVSVDRSTESEFQSDLGYGIKLSSLAVTMSNVTVGADTSEEHSPSRDGNYSSQNFCTRHEESTTESALGAKLEGLWTVCPLSGKATLGLTQANPGTYEALSFSIVPNGAAPSVTVKGTASLDGITYPFEAAIPINEKVTVSGLAIQFEYGHYLPVRIAFCLHYWLDGIDFKNLTFSDGLILISETENAAACSAMKAGIVQHVHVHSGYVSES